MTINLATNYNTKSSEAQDANKLLTSCQDREWASSCELCKLYRSTRLRGIGHFQVVLNLCFKARLSAKPLIWKWFLFQLVQRKLIITRKVLHLKPRFESESVWNSQMAYSKWRTDNPAGTMKSCTSGIIAFGELVAYWSPSLHLTVEFCKPFTLSHIYDHSRGYTNERSKNDERRG